MVTSVKWGCLQKNVILLKLIFTTMEIDSYHLGKFHFFGNEPIILTFYTEIK